MIEPLEARIAPAVFTVTTANPSGAGSLAAAIASANVDSVRDSIVFNIPGTGPHVIAPFSGLPTISQPVTIDGYTQPGSVLNTAAEGTNATLQIVLDGTNADEDEPGLSITGDAVLIRGLVIQGFSGNGITSFIQAAGTVVEGCFIGTSADGYTAVPNENGISIFGANSATIGGSTLGARNLISGNRGDGMSITTNGAIIYNNLIGTDRTGSGPLGNGDDGIALQNGSINNFIGGEAANQPNVIAYNKTGVRVVGDTSAGNRISANRIFASSDLGIDLAPDNFSAVVTENDPADADTGPNALQNFPVITSVTSLPGKLDILLDFPAAPGRSLVVEFFRNDEVNSSGHGEGAVFLGAVVVATGPDGQVKQTVNIDGTLALGQSISATARDSATNDTSEFGPSFSLNGVTIVNDRLATYTESDGDLVTVKVSKGKLTTALFSAAPGLVPGGVRLQRLELTDPQFDGATLSITAKRQELTPGAGLSGNGLVEFGFIDARGIDLAGVTVAGDLARLSAGDPARADGSVALVKTRTYGAALPSSLPTNASFLSEFLGGIKTFQVAGDFRGASVSVPTTDFTPEDLRHARIGKLQIGGHVSGTDLDRSGQIVIEGGVGAATIGGNVYGAAGAISGLLSFRGSSGVITIRGSVIGGEGDNSGVVAIDTATRLLVAGSVIGSDGTNTGGLLVQTLVGDLRIGGNLVGGNGSSSGFLHGNGRVKSLQLRGDLIGSRSPDAGNGGVISIGGPLDSVLIGGSVFGGTNALGISGQISSFSNIGRLTVKGSLVGSEAGPVLISAQGLPIKPATGVDLAIGSILVKGSVTHTAIFAGYHGTSPFNADASIGTVTVLKDWRASSIVAGAIDAGAPGFGQGDTSIAFNDATALTARIASITIVGQLLGNDTQFGAFGFVAQEIGKLQITGFLVPLTSGPSNDPSRALGGNQQVFVEEIS